MRSLMCVTVCLAASLGAGAAFAQHATPGDIADGQRAFGSNCVVCHGPDGNIIPGIDFGRGVYRRDYTDAELVGIIRNGIPNTPMAPQTRISEAQAARIVAYLRELPARLGDSIASGDAARGREVFFGKGACDDCHAAGGEGARHGPALGRIGCLRGALELQASIVDPAAAVQPEARTYQVRLASGEVVTGRLLNHDTFTVQLVDTDDRLRSFAKADLREHGFVGTTMPSYAGTLSDTEIGDLVSFLQSQQGGSCS